MINTNKYSYRHLAYLVPEGVECGGGVFRYLRSCTNAGTMTIDTMKVVNMPNRSVRPTVLMGAIGTIDGHIKTLNPIIVVKADKSIAWPVVNAAETVAPRLMDGSHGSSSSSD